MRTTGAVLLVVALVQACTALAAPRTPAPVEASWPGCEAVGAFTDDPDQERAGVGGVPSGFVATAAVLCEGGERQNAAGDTVDVDLERTSTEIASLLTYLAQPDGRPTQAACTADGWLPPRLYLLDASGHYVAPDIPVDGCGKPLGWNHRGGGLAWETLTYIDRVVREDGVSESAAAKRSGCAMGYKDVVDVYATSSHRRSGGFTRDPFPGGPLTVCVFEVPPSDRGTDAPPGDFVTGRTLAARERTAVVSALLAAPETSARCTHENARFATITRADSGPSLFVELDGCRRVVSDGDSTPLVRAGDDLVALLGG